MTTQPTLSDDLLDGAHEIAAFLGITSRRVYHLAQSRRLPVFRMGAKLCARKSRLIQHIEEQEAQA